MHAGDCSCRRLGSCDCLRYDATRSRRGARRVDAARTCRLRVWMQLDGWEADSVGSTMCSQAAARARLETAVAMGYAVDDLMEMPSPTETEEVEFHAWREWDNPF